MAARRGGRWAYIFAVAGSRGRAPQAFTHDKLDEMIEGLKKRFLADINRNLGTVDIFDYVSYLASVAKKTSRTWP